MLGTCTRCHTHVSLRKALEVRVSGSATPTHTYHELGFTLDINRDLGDIVFRRSYVFVVMQQCV